MERKTKKKEKQVSVTFFSKQKVSCPVCKKDFEKEELMSGGGRLIAGPLTDELRRTYEPSVKYGTLYPLIYAIGACPSCHIGLLWEDFDIKLDDKSINIILDDEGERIESVQAIFPHYNLGRKRTLLDGAAAYYLALLTYEKLPASISPTIKKAQISLRLAWVCTDLHTELPNRNYDYISQLFYRKALFFYQESLLYEMNKTEEITGIKSFGPDIDKNYGYDGVIYLSGLLELKYGQTEDPILRLKKIDEYKRAIARVFGLGKSSKEKPGPLLELSRELYDTFSAILKDASNVDFTPSDDEGDDE